MLVKLDFPIDKIGNGDLNRIAAGLLRNLVDDFLGKGMKQQRPVAFARTDNRVQGLAPTTPVLVLSISPSLNDRPQGLKLLAEVFLMGVDLASNGIALCACFIPGCRIVSFGLILRLGFRKGIVQGPFFGDEFSNSLRVDATDHAALLRHFLCKALA